MMKRKSGQHRADKRKQARADGESHPVILEGSGFTQLELPHAQSVTLTGSAVLEVTAGCISVFGALLTPETGPLTLHAPAKFGKALQLTAVASSDGTEPPHQPAHTPAQAVLQPLCSAEQHQQQASYSITAAADGGGGGDGGDNAAAAEAAAAAPFAWQVSPAWDQAVGDLVAAAAAATSSGLHTPLAVAVAGSKGSGKSAFTRLLVNRLLSYQQQQQKQQQQHGGGGVVAYLDLDPGQPEFTPPGLLSLHLLHQPVFGPSHMQQQQPLVAYFQGDTSSQSEPGRYLQAVQALMQRYTTLTQADLTATSATSSTTTTTARQGGTAGAAPGAAVQEGTADEGAGAGGAAAAQPLQQLPPLVINTPGWITGLGLDLLAEVLRCAQPTHVVQLQTSNAKKNLPAAAWWWQDTAGAAAAAGGGHPGSMPVVLQVPTVSGAAGTEAAAAAVGAGLTAAGCAPADSLLSVPSGDTTQAAAGGGAGGGGKGSAVKGVSAAAARSLMWLAWADRVCAANPTAGGAAAEAGATTASTASAEDFAGAAAALAAAVPVVVSLQDLQVEVLHAQVAPAELPVALNGAVVGLAASSSSSSALLNECLGLGLIRAVDGAQQELCVLTDLSEQQLQRVDLLQVGKLELPDKLLECRSFASPYQGLFCLTSTATGAGQIKSRNNLLRSSHLLR